MRVLSLVPSWTETLIRAGIEVCGRTRFCIHPHEAVAQIPIVGGTKNVQWEKVRELRPDLILLDKEENPQEFAHQNEFPWIATHVTDLRSCHDEMNNLGRELKNQKLIQWGHEYHDLLEKEAQPWSFQNIPGKLADLVGDSVEEKKVVYVIWRDPWMVVNQDTYIGSVLQYLKAPLLKLDVSTKYPEVSDKILQENFCLFSSEPYPFLKKKDQLIAENRRGVIVDGEGYSWFGIRGLNFLKAVQYKP